MSQMKDIADTYKCRHERMPISHKNIVDTLPSEYSGGACSALTLIYLACYGRNQFDPFEEDFEQALTEDSSTMLIQQFQQMETSRSDIFNRVIKNARREDDANERRNMFKDMWDAVGFEPLVLGNLEALGCQGMNVLKDEPGDILTLQDETPYEEMAAYIAKTEGLHYIKFNSHAVGAIVHDDPYWNYLFFDSNYGQVKTSNAQAFKQFLHDFFASSTVRGYNRDRTPAALISIQFDAWRN